MKDLLKRLDICILSKEGENGATIITQHYLKHEDAFKPDQDFQIVDTTGAGDTFTAAYAITSDLKFAQAAAFLCITKHGAA